MSPPALFVIAMEVLAMIIQRKVQSHPGFKSHWRGQATKAVHFCFANDFIFFCHAYLYSAAVLKEALDFFDALSGLHPKKSKSQIFLAVIDEVRDPQSIREMVDFRKVRYLSSTWDFHLLQPSSLPLTISIWWRESLVE